MIIRKILLRIFLFSMFFVALNPYTTYGQSNNYVDEFSKVKWGHIFNDPTTAPQIHIIEEYPNEFGNDKQVFQLKLEGAIWLRDHDFTDNTFKSAMENLSYLQDTLSLDIERLSDTTVQATVYNKGSRNNRLTVQIPILAKIIDSNFSYLTDNNPKVRIEPLNSSISVGTYVFAHGRASDTISKIDTIKEFRDGEELKLGNIYIEECINDTLPNSTGAIVLKLRDGFEWVQSGAIECFGGLKGSTSKIKIDGDTINVSMDYSKGSRNLRGTVMFKNFSIKAVNNKSNEDVTLLFDGDNITTQTITIAKHIQTINNTANIESFSDKLLLKKDEDAQLVEKELGDSKEIIIPIQDKKETKIYISLSTIKKMVETKKPLKIKNKAISLVFSDKALLFNKLKEGKEDISLEISVKQIDDMMKKNILSKTLGDASNGLFQIDSEIFELSCAAVNKKGSTEIFHFNDPIAITIDLSDKSLSKEEVENLTGIRYEKDEKENIIPIKLGGTYDPDTRTFTFYTDQFSLYGVLKVQDLAKINLTIDDTYANINNIPTTLELAPTIINNRTMVPLRFIAEGLGANVEWIDQTKTVKLELNNKKLSLAIGEKQKGMDVPAMIKNGRTLVPIRYVSENLGANVLWFPSSQKIEIVK